MPDVLFVHGTGVRRVSYDGALASIRRKSAEYLNGAKVRPCLWGEPEGAKLRLEGASIPTYEDQPGPALTAAQADEMESVTWRMLREDPIFELRLLENIPSPRVELPPGSQPPGRTSWKLLCDWAPSGEVMRVMGESGLESYWKAGKDSLVNSTEVEGILTKANRDPREVSRALSRALVASVTSLAMSEGHPGISGDTRDLLVDLLIPQLGQLAFAPFDWITRPLAGLIKRVGTYKARRARHALTDASSPVAGDILLYQARGRGIRNFIRDRINESPGDLIVFAHSLGGIATVDLLVIGDLSAKVKGLVTLGSQAPFLYEIGALKSLPFGCKLPDHFPRQWLNIYDPNDFLSYQAAGVFGTRAVKDVMVRSRMPFPDSHSAYWDQDATWKAIQKSFTW